MNLKYKFTAVYKDGTTYQQNEEDKSLTKENGSSFSDVIMEEIKTFSLIGDGHNYLVNLVDGHFEIDGLPFTMHDEVLTDFRIVFWRKHTHSFNQYQDELSHKVLYQIGWQANDKDGKNIQRVMTIK